MRSPHFAANSVGLHWFLHLYVTPVLVGSAHFSSSLRHIDPLPSVPSHVTSIRAARQLSRMGVASSGSKLGGQLQIKGGSVAVSPGVVAASLVSLLDGIFPPHAASQARARNGASRTEGMVEGYAMRGPPG
jgi:hypothetical protein